MTFKKQRMGVILHQAIIVLASAVVTFAASATCWLTVDTGGKCCDGLISVPVSHPACPPASFTSNPPILAAITDPCGRPNKINDNCICIWTWYQRDAFGVCVAVASPIPLAHSMSDGLWCPCDPE